MTVVRLIFIFAIIGCSSCIYSNRLEKSNQAASDILTRLLGNNSTFSTEINPGISSNGKLTFTLFKNSSMDSVHIIGSSGVAVAWGAHHYLRKFTSSYTSWDGDRIALPTPLPDVNVTIQSLDKWMYYQNVCTVSYSSVWWDWERWEREIDWMALNGINLALAFTAQESIWRRVYDGIGLINDSFTGPAFLAWGRMGNIHEWGGGLNMSWHNSQIQLQHQILDRMRDLGITSVLPAFAGYVPTGFTKVFPLANVTKLRRWNSFDDNYCCPDLLSFDDPLFPVIGRVFLGQYINEFGTDHIYNCDTFNENDPSSSETEYLQSAARAIFNYMTDVDPEAIWMLQAWQFLSPFWGKQQVQDYLTAIPQGKFLILDLQADLTPLYEKFDNFYGQPFIWCTLHNFGGQLGMFGHLENINKGIANARKTQNATLVGLGIVPEGIGQNYVIYDFTLQGNLMGDRINLSDWIVSYSEQRYGFNDNNINTAWQILRETVYNYDPQSDESHAGVTRHIETNIMVHLPAIGLTEIVWYDRYQVFEAWQLLITGANSLSEVPFLLQHDLVDVTRQIFQLAFGRLYNKLVFSYIAGHEADVKIFGALIQGLLNDLDTVLATNKNFLLGKWLQSARNAGSTPEEKTLFEWNARNQITLWGPNGEIRDYAAKQWQGMVQSIYLPRWTVFVKALVDDVTNVTKYNQTVLKQYIFENIEQPFTLNTNDYTIEPIGNTLEIVNNINESWFNYLTDILGPTPKVVLLSNN